jgi:predicted membrane-bound spermidine synthase
MFPAISARIYGADLIGAATGSLGVILALNILGGTSTSFFLGLTASVAALLFAMRVIRKNVKGVKISIASLLSIASFLIVAGLLGANLSGFYCPDVPIGINPAKQSYVGLNPSLLQGEIIETRWSAYGRTDLVDVGINPELMLIYIDGTAGSLMYRFNGDFNQPGPLIDGLKSAFLGYFPFLFLQEEEKDNALIIGSGGGADILVALMGGVREITAVEVNRDMVDIVREYSWYNGGIYTNFDNVDVVVDEGRSFLKRQKEKYDIIMISFPYTESSRSLEGYMLTENFLFTTDSINDYLNHLTSEGRLVVSSNNQVEILRLLSISLAALNERNISNEAALKHIYIQGEAEQNLFVMKKTPFEPTEMSPRYEAMHQLGYDPALSYFPYISGELNPLLTALGNGEIILDDLEKIYKEQGYNISPVTDNSPFFYNFSEGIPQPVSIALWSAITIMLLVVVVPPLYWKKRSFQREAYSKSKRSFTRNPLRFVVLFSMLGIGFMLVEISLMQRFVLFLGQPVLSMATLLFSLLVGAGIGSICSGRLAPKRIIQGIALASLLIVAFLVSYTFLLPFIFNQFLGLSLTIRLIIAIITLTPLGFLIGFPFPLSVRLLKEMKVESHIPWMLGINGISCVLGSVMTIVIAISFGFTEALLVGAGCYFVVFLIFQKSSIKASLALKRIDNEK